MIINSFYALPIFYFASFNLLKCLYYVITIIIWIMAHIDIQIIIVIINKANLHISMFNLFKSRLRCQIFYPKSVLWCQKSQNYSKQVLLDRGYWVLQFSLGICTTLKANANMSWRNNTLGCPTTPLRPGHHFASKSQHKKTVEHAINCLTTEMVSPKR